MLAQRGDERRRGIVRFSQKTTAGDALAFFERLEDHRLLLRPHALQRADAAVLRRALEVLERADRERVIEQGDRLRADALQVQQVEDGRRKLLQQLLVVWRAAAFDQLVDARREVLADARDAAALLRRHRRDR